MDGSLKARTLFEEESETTPVLQEKPFFAREYKRIAENQSAQTPYGSWLPERTQQSEQTTSLPFSRRIYQQHFGQEHIITMSKMSLFGLISGLMLLGVLFFMAGFLVALGTLEPSRPPATLPPSSWGDMNASSTAASTGAQSQKRIFASMAQQQLSQASSGAVTKFVPRSLQPFAQQLNSQETSAAQSAFKSKKPNNKVQQQPQPNLQSGGPGPGDSPLQAQGVQQAWPQQQQPQQVYVPPPVSTYVPPPPVTYSASPYSPQY